MTRILRIVIPVILTLILFGGIFVLTMQAPTALHQMPEPETGSGQTVFDETPTDETPSTATPYSLETAKKEGFMYAADAITHLTMYSGLGVTFKPSAEEIQSWLDASGSAVPPFENPAYLSVPFVRGNSMLPSESLDAADALTLRWNTNERHTKVDPETVAAAMQAELDLSEAYLGLETNRMQYNSIALGRMASEGMKFLEEKMKLPSGLYALSWQGDKIINSNVDISAQFAVLEAYARLTDYAATYPQYYISPVEPNQIAPLMDSYFTSLRGSIMEDETKLTTLHERDLAHVLEALSWYNVTTIDPDLQTQSKDLLTQTADALRLAEATTAGVRPVATQAAKVVGYGLASHVMQDTSLERDAQTSFESLESHWRSSDGILLNDVQDQAMIFTPRDLADIVNAYRVADALFPAENQNGSTTESSATSMQTDRSGRLVTLMEHLIKNSGVQPSEDSGADAIVPHDFVPATGSVHKAPVSIAAVAYLPAEHHWVTLDANVDTAAAFELAAALLETTTEWTTGHRDAHGLAQ